MALPIDKVSIAFKLSAEVQAEFGALCGEFNDWSLDEPGHSDNDALNPFGRQHPAVLVDK